MKTQINQIVKNILNTYIHHPLLAILIASLTLFYTIEGAIAATTAPLQETKVQIAQLVVSTGAKIINIEEGCAHKNSFTSLIQNQNAERIEDADQLLALVTANTHLNTVSKKELLAFIQYNSLLSQRKDICHGQILSQTAINAWEQTIIENL